MEKNLKKEPVYKYAEVNGYWKEDKSEFSGYIIKLNYIVKKSEDNKIFYYCNGEAGLKTLMYKHKNKMIFTPSGKVGTDFVITSYTLLKTIDIQ